jgi:hypothetical protein
MRELRIAAAVFAAGLAASAAVADASKGQNDVLHNTADCNAGHACQAGETWDASANKCVQLSGYNTNGHPNSVKSHSNTNNNRTAAAPSSGAGTEGCEKPKN